jgi:hypothetical protein
MIQKFDEYLKAIDDVKNYKRSILKLIDEYVKIYLTHIKYYSSSVDFYFTRDDKFIISYLSKSGDSNTITFDINNESYKNLIKFIDEPELYKNQNKYNL